MSGARSLAAAPPLGIVLGWSADRALGDPVRGHPVAVVGAFADRLERRLWRDRRSVGAAYVLAVVAATALPVRGLDGRLPPLPRLLVAAAVTWTALGGRSLRRTALALADDLDAGDLAAARRRLPGLCGRDPHHLDADGLTRAALESVAENTSDAVVATLLAAAVAGPTGVAAHRVVNTLDAMVGHRSRRHVRFGWAAARLDDVVAWVPARVTALLAVALAGVVGGEPRHAWRVLRRDGRHHPSPNAGPTEAAWAGALGRRLGGGENRYPDHVERRPTQGDGPAPDTADLRRAVRLAGSVEVAALGLALVIATARAVREARR